MNFSAKSFRNEYHPKEELMEFCRKNGLQATGSKEELTERVARFLETGERIVTKHDKAVAKGDVVLTVNSLIEPNFICSEKHRAFFKSQIGKSFSFNVAFQNWLKSNAGKTYQEAIEAYHKTRAEQKEHKKNHDTKIGKQFEYNTYIRDFFADNKGRGLDEAIKCWNYKKAQPGSHKYEKSDLEALK